MPIKVKSVILGAFLAYLVLGLFVAGIIWSTVSPSPTIREQLLESGKIIKILSLHLVWGIEHDERDITKDCFALEYVGSDSKLNSEQIDQETLEVFELIRPISEQWNFNIATVSAFPKPERKGSYFIYAFSRNTGGKWEFKRSSAKVYIND